MVNPYVSRQRFGSSPAVQHTTKPTSQVSLGQSQALKRETDKCYKNLCNKYKKNALGKRHKMNSFNEYF
jgi:hypothetical protein